MTIALARIDDRLIHGQVIVGWGHPLDARFVALVDDAVAASEWEQELYRLAVPPELELVFTTVAGAAAALPDWQARPEAGIVLTGDVATMADLVRAGEGILRAINLGGIHHQPGRTERLPYVYLTDDELAQLERLAETGAVVTAQDVPATRPVPLEGLR